MSSRELGKSKVSEWEREPLWIKGRLTKMMKDPVERS